MSNFLQRNFAMLASKHLVFCTGLCLCFNQVHAAEQSVSTVKSKVETFVVLKNASKNTQKTAQTPTQSTLSKDKLKAKVLPGTAAAKVAAKDKPTVTKGASTPFQSSSQQPKPRTLLAKHNASTGSKSGAAVVKNAEPNPVSNSKPPRVLKAMHTPPMVQVSNGVKSVTPIVVPNPSSNQSLQSKSKSLEDLPKPSSAVKSVVPAQPKSDLKTDTKAISKELKNSTEQLQPNSSSLLDHKVESKKAQSLVTNASNEVHSKIDNAAQVIQAQKDALSDQQSKTTNLLDNSEKKLTQSTNELISNVKIVTTPSVSDKIITQSNKISAMGSQLSDLEVISVVKQAVNQHEQKGMDGLQQASEQCYTSEANQHKCLYYDLAARKIDLMVAQTFNSNLNTYFDDATFGWRLIDVYTKSGLDANQANEFLRSAAPQVNNYVVQKVKLTSFIK